MLEMWMNLADFLLGVETNVLCVINDRKDLVYLLFEFLVRLGQFSEELMINLDKIQEAVVTHQRLG